MPRTTFAQAEKEKLMRERDILPPLSESPFGAFPPGWSKHTSEKINVSSTAAAAGSRKKPATYGTTFTPTAADSSKRPDIFIANTGTGGMAVSTFKGRGGAWTSLRDGRFGDPKGPGKAGAMTKKKIPPTDFRIHYERGLPVSIQHAASRLLVWRADPATFDYHHYLPLFFDGLRELEQPYSFVAFEGSMNLLDRGGPKILPTVPQLIIPLKTALSTRHPDIIVKVMKVIQKLVVSGEFIGEALVPYYRQLLPVFNLFKDKSKNLGDRMDFGQYKERDVSKLISETLNMLERYGGEDAYINIKYMIPTYESCM